MQRSKRARQSCVIETPFGLLQGKLGWRHGERPLFTPEFDACAKMATERKVPIREIYRVAEQCFAEQIEKAFDQHEHDHDGGHDHDHDSEHDHDCGHDHDHDGSHDHDCEHDHDHDKGHSHDHDHDSSPKRKKSQ